MQCEIPHSALIRGLGAPCGVWVSAAVSSNSMCHSVLTELPREHAFPTHKVVSRAQVHGLFKKELGWGMLSGRTERPGRGYKRNGILISVVCVSVSEGASTSIFELF